MAVTLIAAVMVMAAYFLVLYAGVAFIQDKRFFSSAPKENLAVIPDRKERFRGAHAIGWIIAVIAVLLFIAAAVLSAWDGIKRGFGFKEFLLDSWRCSILWRYMIYSFLIGCCSAIQTSFRIITPNSRG